MTATSRADDLNLVDQPGVADTLRVALVTVFAFALAISVFTLFLRWQLAPQLALVAGASCLVALVLSRSGRIRRAMMVPLLSITYVVLHLAARSDGMQSIGLAILPVLIVLGSLALERLTLVFFTAGIILATFGMLAIRYFVLRAERYSTNDMGDFFIFALTCTTAALVGRLFALRIKEGFRQAQAYCQALGVAERRVRLVADSLSEMVVAYDMHRSLTYANSGAEKLTGYSLVELQAAAPLSWTHEEDRPQMLALWDKLFSGQRVDQVVHRLITKDGTVKWVAGSWGPVTDEAGQLVGIRGTCQDLTERVVAEQLLEETTQKFRTIVEEIAERKRAEQALRESEERFRAIFSQAAVGIAQTSIEGEFLLLNNRYGEILGYTQIELRGKTILDITHPDDREMSLVAKRQLLSDEIPSWSREKRYLRKDGSIVWARLCVSLVRDEVNRPQYFISVVEDVTERVLTERALRDSEQRRMLAQSAAHMGLWERDLRTNVKTISGEYAKLYGLAPDHSMLTYEEWLSLIHPDDREWLQAHIRESIKRTDSWEGEFRVVWPDGRVRWLFTKGTVFLDDSGQPVRTAGVNFDITERKQIEAALRESEQRFRNMADAAPVMIWVTGPDKLCTFFNKTWLNFTGRSMEQGVGNGWAASVHPDDLSRCYESYSSSFDARRNFNIEHRLRRADGEYRWVLCTGVPRFDPSGAFAGYIGSDIDITDQKCAEAALRRSLNEVAHLNRVAAMAELTVSLAHEINQPLAAILSNAQAASRFLTGESPDLVQVRACLTDIVADDKRAGEVIKRLRGMLKKGEFQPSSVDLNEVVSDAIRLVRNDSLLRQVTVKFEPSPGLAPVLGDRIQLYQVVLNLIMNALEAAEHGTDGERWVSVRTGESESGGVQLTVEDSGHGIAESDLARVFEPFFTSKQEGLGMGLSISQSIVRVHGGRLCAENSARGGAIFRCVLPEVQQTLAAVSR